MDEKIIKFLENSESKFWDVRFENKKSQSVSAWNGQINNISESNSQGYSIRVCYKNGIGFATGNNYDLLMNSCEDALKMAKSLNNITKEERGIYTGNEIKDDCKTKVKEDIEDVFIEDKKKFVLECSKYVENESNLDSNQFVYSDSKKVKQYFNSEGSDIKQTLSYVYGGDSLVASKLVNGEKRIETYASRTGKLSGFEITKEIYSKIDESLKNVNLLLDAKDLKSGNYEVICDPTLADVFIHEALGHACEADIVEQGDSCLENRTGEQLATDKVNVYDEGLGNTWGSFFYDDEGIKAQKTCLIKNGKLNSYMHSRETAWKHDILPTGNGRSETVTDIPIVRMRNTYIDKGEDKFDDMVSSIKNGVFMLGSKGGQVDTAKGSYQFSAKMGFKIENGEITEPVREVSLSGTTLSTLSNIEMIGNKRLEGFPGFCGKGGQSVPVIGNNPFIKLSDGNVGGK